MRTVGVEEELLLFDMHTGKPHSVAGQVIAATGGDSRRGAGEGRVEAELQRYMVETQSSVASELADVEEQLRNSRHLVASAAQEAARHPWRLRRCAEPSSRRLPPRRRTAIRYPQVPTSLLRLAVWRAGHDGVGGVLVDPVSGRPRPRIEVMRDLLSPVHDSLEEVGDLERVEVGIDRLTRVGSGATGQGRTFAKTGQIVDVVVEAVPRTTSR